MTIKYINIFPSFAQIWIFGLKRNHLATQCIFPDFSSTPGLPDFQPKIGGVA
jgi:hypothetical protein